MQRDYKIYIIWELCSRAIWTLRLCTTSARNRINLDGDEDWNCDVFLIFLEMLHLKISEALEKEQAAESERERDR